MWLLWLGLARAEVVDRILHVVGDRIVTSSDLAFEADLDPHDQSPVPALDAPDYALEERLVDFAILRDLAGDVAIYAPSPAEVRARWERVRASWPTRDEHDAFLARWGLDDERLMGQLYSRMVVERYVLRNLAPARGEGAMDEAAWSALYRPWIARLREQATIRTPQ